MNALALTHNGLEDISATEIKQLIPAKNITTTTGRVSFECTEQELAYLTYHSRTITKTVLILEERTINGMPSTDMLKAAKPYLGKTAVVQCERTGKHNYTSFDAAQEFNKQLAKQTTIDYKKPQTTLMLLIDDNNAILGVDFAGIDLGRRSYRIFLGTEALKGTIAAGLLFFSEYQPKQVLVDPFCRHGVIPIEAALYATNTSPNKFDKEKMAFSKLPGKTFSVKDSEKDFTGTIIAMDNNFKHVSAAQKNAKIAGIVKNIEFSRTDLEWLDAKFGKTAVDSIVTFPPQPGRSLAENTTEKIYHQLFYHAEFILKKTGKVALCMKRGTELAKKKATEFKFNLENERKVMQGEEELTFLLFAKAQ